MEDTIGNWWRPNFEPPQVSRLLSEMYIGEETDIWMEDMKFYILLNSISVIS